MKIIGIIPARYASSRFPGKPLVDIAGKSMIQRVLEGVNSSNLFTQIFVATDDQRIFDHVTELGWSAIMTSNAHQSGTDRCAEALAKCGYESDAVVNIQGDEPMIQTAQLQSLIQLIQQPHVDIATLIKPISDVEQLFDPNKVKVISDLQGKAMYFSRQAIPMQRDTPNLEWLNSCAYYKHLGLYAYKTDVLHQLVQLPMSALEKAESLEQLRWLENGYRIYTEITNQESPAIDTPQDLENLLANWSKY